MTQHSTDDVWFAVAEAVALRSRCDRAQVGAVVLDKTGRVVSTGYNGPPAGFPAADTSCSAWCRRAQNDDLGKFYGLACPSVHAEANALLYADRTRVEGGSIYVSRSCCADCAKLIANSGIKNVYMRVTAEDEHRDPAAVADFLVLCGLRVVSRYDSGLQYTRV